MTPRHQHGAALLLIMMMLVVAALSWGVNYLNKSGGELKAAREAKTTEALALAKAAVIAESLSSTNPGRLICPEDTTVIGTPLEGQARGACSNTALTIGRLAWRSLGAGDLRDGDGNALWYVYSPGFQASPINTDTPAQLLLDGRAMVAIIFSPGPTLTGQNRPAASAIPNVTAYLDGENANGDFIFTSPSDNQNINDRAIGITKDELFVSLAGRVVATARGVDTANGLRQYFAGNGNNLPWAASATDGSQQANLAQGFLPDADLNYPDAGSYWIHPPPPVANRNDWLRLIQYQRISSNRAKLWIPSAGGKEYFYDFP